MADNSVPTRKIKLAKESVRPLGADALKQVQGAGEGADPDIWGTWVCPTIISTTCDRTCAIGPACC